MRWLFTEITNFLCVFAENLRLRVAISRAIAAIDDSDPDRAQRILLEAVGE